MRSFGNNYGNLCKIFFYEETIIIDFCVCECVRLIQTDIFINHLKQYFMRIALWFTNSILLQTFLLSFVFKFFDVNLIDDWIQLAFVYHYCFVRLSQISFQELWIFGLSTMKVLSIEAEISMIEFVVAPCWCLADGFVDGNWADLNVNLKIKFRNCITE